MTDKILVGLSFSGDVQARAPKPSISATFAAVIPAGRCCSGARTGILTIFPLDLGSSGSRADRATACGGQRRHPLSEIRSRDDATLARYGASISEPLRLVSADHFLKPLGRLSAKEIYILINLFQFRSTRHGIGFEFYQEFRQWAKICCKFYLPDD